uniref:Candidate secreted effector n=1 Tax=Meloidogyne incognita TaxID=6306 RepID=A0A914L0V7_MELIC
MFVPFVVLVQYMEKKKLDGQIYLDLKLQHKLLQPTMEKEGNHCWSNCCGNLWKQWRRGLLANKIRTII